MGAAVATHVDLVFAEVDVAVGGRIRRENREHDLLVLVTRNWSHQQDVGLLVAVLGEVNPFGLFLDLVGPAVLRRQGESVRKHHNSAYLKTHIAAVSTDLLETVLIGNLHAGGEDAVGEDRLRNFSLGQLFGQGSWRKQSCRWLPGGCRSSVEPR